MISASKRFATFTNIAAGNPYRCLIEYMGDWFLIERSESDLLRLCSAANVPATLATLTQLPALRSLYLWETSVTDAAVDGLRAAKPTMRVVRAAPATADPVAPVLSGRARRMPRRRKEPCVE